MSERGRLVYLELRKRAKEQGRTTDELLTLFLLRAEAIRDEDEYSGVRIRLTARLHTARLRMHVEVNVGDPIDPPPTEVSVPRLLKDWTPIVLRGYPMPMVFAEKLVTAIQRGIANTRRRDFGDIWTLSHMDPVDGSALMQAIDAVRQARKVTLMPLADALENYGALAQGAMGAMGQKAAIVAAQRIRRSSTLGDRDRRSCDRPRSHRTNLAARKCPVDEHRVSLTGERMSHPPDTLPCPARYGIPAG